MKQGNNNNLSIIMMGAYQACQTLMGVVFFYAQAFYYQLPILHGSIWLGVYDQINQEGILTVIKEAYTSSRTHPLGMSYFHLGSGPVLLITRPEHIKTIMIQQSSHLTRAGGLGRETAKLFGPSIFYRKAKRWTCRRHSWRTTLFSPSALQDAEMKMSGIIRIHMDTYLQDNKDPVDLRVFFSRLVLDIIGQILLQHPNLPDYVEQLTQLLEEGLNKTNAPREVLLNHFAPLIHFFKLNIQFTDFNALKIKLITFFKKHITNEPEVSKQILRTLLSSCLQLGMCDENNPRTSILDESIFLLLASYHTTVQCLLFLVLHLSTHPDYEHQLTQALSNLTPNTTINFPQLEALELLDHVIKETLRLTPPIPFLHRHVEKSFTITTTRGSFLFSHALDILIPSFLLQRSPEYFEDPDSFIPERFSQQHLKKKHPIDYAFGIGPRSCIGQRFALQEIKLIVAYLYSQYQIKVISPSLSMNPHRVTLALSENPCAYFYGLSRSNQPETQLTPEGYRHDSL